jgi:hypothetical protein
LSNSTTARQGGDETGKTEFKVEVGKEEFTPQHPYPDIYYDEDGSLEEEDFDECSTCGLDLSESVCDTCWRDWTAAEKAHEAESKAARQKEGAETGHE